MGGRARPFLRDGEWIGYRKTPRRQSVRRSVHELPFWTAGFELPDGIGLAPGYQHGLVGVKVAPPAHVTVTGKGRDWVLRQAFAFVRKVAPFWRREIQIRLTRPAESGPAISGPRRAAIDRVVVLRFDHHKPVEVDGLAMRQLELVT